MGIGENLNEIRNYTSGARIIAVTKYVSADVIVEAYEAGIRDFGENKAQDAEKKRKELPQEINKNCNWHFLGHLQTNKVKNVVGEFDYIHSVDSVRLLKAISEYAALKGIKQRVLIQVNIADEESKFGFKPTEIEEVFLELLNFPSVEVVGFMTMAPFTTNIQEQKAVFRGLRELKERLEKKFNAYLPELSMGMSNDYKIAVNEGSTMVRIGQAIFR